MIDRKLNLRDKVEQINQRFALKTKKNHNTDNLENKLIQMRKKLTTLSHKNNEEMENIKLNAALLLKKTQESNIEYQNEATMQLRQLEFLTHDLTSKIQSQISFRKQKQSQLIDLIQKKSKFMKSQIQKQKQFRDNILLQISSTLQKDVPCLMKLIIDASSQRQQDQQKLTSLISGQLTSCKSSFSTFKQTQEQNQKKTFELVRQLTLKAKREIQEQRKVRQQTHDDLLTYVEETCNQLSNI